MSWSTTFRECRLTFAVLTSLVHYAALLPVSASAVTAWVHSSLHGFTQALFTTRRLRPAVRQRVHTSLVQYAASVTAWADRTSTVWSAAYRECLPTFTGHKEHVEFADAAFALRRALQIGHSLERPLRECLLTLAGHREHAETERPCLLTQRRAQRHAPRSARPSQRPTHARSAFWSRSLAILICDRVCWRSVVHSGVCPRTAIVWSASSRECLLTFAGHGACRHGEIEFADTSSRPRETASFDGKAKSGTLPPEIACNFQWVHRTCLLRGFLGPTVLQC